MNFWNTKNNFPILGDSLRTLSGFSPGSGELGPNRVTLPTSNSHDPKPGPFQTQNEPQNTNPPQNHTPPSKLIHKIHSLPIRTLSLLRILLLPPSYLLSLFFFFPHIPLSKLHLSISFSPQSLISFPPIHRPVFSPLSHFLHSYLPSPWSDFVPDGLDLVSAIFPTKKSRRICGPIIPSYLSPLTPPSLAV